MTTYSAQLSARSQRGEAQSEELVDVLGEAALRGRLSWRTVDGVLAVLERYAWLAEARAWAVYEALDAAPAPAETEVAA